MKNFYYLTVILFVFSCSEKNNTIGNHENQNANNPAFGKSAMIVSAHPLATQSGIEILKKGGNAFDATVAVHFALQVVFPEAGNIGGGGFAVFRLHNGNIGSLDFREKAPLKSDRNMYLDGNGDVIPMKSRLGHLAAGTPGSVAGMWELHKKHGVLSWQEVLKPSIRLAYNGHVLTEYAANNLNEKQDDFKKVNNFEPWVINKNGWAKGDSIKQRELAATLTIIQEKGRDGFYKGIIADQIEKEMKKGNGLITKEDLEKYEPVWRTPIVGNYKNHKIITMPPPSSGGIALMQLLQGAEKFDFSVLGHNSPQMIHYKTEIERRVYADRSTHLGDPDFNDIPVAMLLDKEYNNQRFENIKKNKKTPSSEIKEGKVDFIESIQTTHYSIVDNQGNAVSVTSTLNGYFGCKVMVEGAGFFLNNEMDDFSTKPGVPNMFGLVGGEINAIAPEKRMLSSMTPTIVEKNGTLFLITGTPGGATIITSVFQSIVNVIDFNMSMQESVNAHRLHSQWLPDVILMEKNALSTQDSLRLTEMGHVLQKREYWGKVNAILKNDSTYEGAADWRGDNYAEGY